MRGVFFLCFFWWRWAGEGEVGGFLEGGFLEGGFLEGGFLEGGFLEGGFGRGGVGRRGVGGERVKGRGRRVCFFLGERRCFVFFVFFNGFRWCSVWEEEGGRSEGCFFFLECFFEFFGVLWVVFDGFLWGVGGG